MLGNLLYAYPNNTDEDNLSYVIENLLFAYIYMYGNTKAQVSCVVIPQLISAFVIAT